MVEKILYELRNRPREARRRLAFLGAVTLTSMIAGLWLFTLPTRFDFGDKTDTNLTTTTDAPLFGSLWNELKSQFSSLGSQTARVLDSATTTSPVITSTSTFDALLLLGTSTTEEIFAPEVEPTPVLLEIVKTATSSDGVDTE